MNLFKIACYTLIAGLSLYLGYLLIQFALNNENNYLIDLREKYIILPFVPGLLLAFVGVLPMVISVVVGIQKNQISNKTEGKVKQTVVKSKTKKALFKLDLPTIVIVIMFIIGVVLGLVYVLFIK